MTKRTLLAGALVVLLVVGFCAQPLLFGDDIGPIPPDGLVLVVGVSWVDAGWNASTEPDIGEDGYRLYRRELQEGVEPQTWELLIDGLVPEFPGDYELIADGIGTWYHDVTVQHGKMYGYVISVTDADKSESAPSTEAYTNAPVYGPGTGTGSGGCFLSTVR